MVVALGPGKFYGSSLPRPRFYTDVKFNDERVDPPAPMLDPFLSWANDAHWSMGGLNFKRVRLQGRIEGNIKRLRAQREKFKKKKSQLVDSPSPIVDRSIADSSSKVPSPPPAPIANKRRRRLVAAIEEDEEQEIENIVDVFSTKKRVLARKLDDEFDRVATDGHVERSRMKRPQLDLNTVPMRRTRNKRSEIENVKDANEKNPARVTRGSSSSPETATRSSPRFLKRGLTKARFA
ncbi:uncharacterized protein LOC124910227 [Impatiens glandulifera]|uniref:uncharacterized protein LOC124910227 n=1 Tax=Impatiens glandulifera TaxID=253017 RepID=UPI001FB0F8BF|nr:uncharacterized protein LOC124910227 [Impatiens glandulifera]